MPEHDEAQVSLQQWRALLAVVEAGGVHRGARQIGRSHSAVSQAIARLEEILGVELFVPAGRGVEPTEIGRAMAKRAARVLRAARALEAFAESRRVGWESALRVAIDVSSPNELVMAALARWGPRSRGTSVTLVRVIAEAARAASQDPSLDLVLSGALAPGVTPRPIASVAFALVVGKRHPAAAALRSGATDLDSILASPQVVVGEGLPDEGEGWRVGVERWTVPDFELARAALETGIPFALLPQERLGAARDALVRVPEEGLATTRQLHLVQPRGGETGPAAQELADCFLAAGAAYEERRAAAAAVLPGS